MNKRLGLALFFITLLSLALAQFNDSLTEDAWNLTVERAGNTEESEEYGFVATETVWKFSGDPKINVCWENPDVKYMGQMNLVKTAIEESWQYHSALEFVDWTRCPAQDYVGIRIKIADENPYVRGWLFRNKGTKSVTRNRTFTHPQGK